MKLINQKAELLIQQDWKKQIEIAARTCYKSEDKIAEGTADKMLEKLINSKHYSMLEHGTIYLHLTQPTSKNNEPDGIFKRYKRDKYSDARLVTDYSNKPLTTEVYITTNYRVIVENNWEDDLKYICEPTAFHRKRYTFRLITSIGIVRELLRHKLLCVA